MKQYYCIGLHVHMHAVVRVQGPTCSGKTVHLNQTRARCEQLLMFRSLIADRCMHPHPPAGAAGDAWVAPAIRRGLLSPLLGAREAEWWQLLPPRMQALTLRNTSGALDPRGQARFVSLAPCTISLGASRLQCHFTASEPGSKDEQSSHPPGKVESSRVAGCRWR